jgi:hypothetical protein
MKFFRLRDSTDLTIIGDYPQIQKMSVIDSQYEHPQYFRNLPKFRLGKLDCTPIFDTFLLTHKAKFSDSISSNFLDFTINKKMLDVLLQFNLSNYEVYPIKVQKGKKILDYYCFCLE